MIENQEKRCAKAGGKADYPHDDIRHLSDGPHLLRDMAKEYPLRGTE